MVAIKPRVIVIPTYDCMVNKGLLLQQFSAWQVTKILFCEEIEEQNKGYTVN